MNARTVLAAFCAALFCCNGGSSTTTLGTPDPTPPPPPTYSTAPRDKAEPTDRTLTFFYGPMKLMTAEAILYSVASFTGHPFNSFDFTAPDPAARGFVDAGNAQDSMYRHCLFFGGCMEHRIPLGRTSFMGTGWVLELERAVVEACNDRAAFQMFPGNRAPDAATLAIDVVRHQFMRAFGEQPSDDDLQAAMAYMQGHVASPELTGITPLESAGRGLCRALLTTNRFLFY